MAGKDKELAAIGSIIALLMPLDEGERSRVLEYVLKRLDMATVRAPAGAVREAVSPGAPTARPLVDIRTLTAEKQPRSANEMAALIGYYVSELAPETERSDTVNVETMRRYFKMAAFPIPSALRNLLPNAAAAGYFENVTRGEYRLNPVGYNLVVHGLPRSSSPGPMPQAGRSARRTASKKPRKPGRRGR